MSIAKRGLGHALPVLVAGIVALESQSSTSVLAGGTDQAGASRVPSGHETTQYQPAQRKGLHGYAPPPQAPATSGAKAPAAKSYLEDCMESFAATTHLSKAERREICK